MNIDYKGLEVLTDDYYDTNPTYLFSFVWNYKELKDKSGFAYHKKWGLRITQKEIDEKLEEGGEVALGKYIIHTMWELLFDYPGRDQEQGQAIKWWYWDE